MIRNERLTAVLDEPCVVFLIGMRINKPWLVHKWLPVMRAMPRMLQELRQRPELRFIHAEAWLGRTAILVQYWRSIEYLHAYADDHDAAHLPAWREFNRTVGTSGCVGVWHETYVTSPGSCENVYVNMPPFGLGKVSVLQPAIGALRSAAGRMGRDRPPA